MFTGLVREIGTVKSLASRGGILRLEIAADLTAGRLAVGASVAVDGICLTATKVGRGVFCAEAAAETRRLTTLPHWRRGRRVHLEPALRAGDPLDGHLVQGHVDGTGRVRSVSRAAGGGRLITIALGPGLAEFLVPKGSIAVDGVSLTLDEGPFRDAFTVNLIPHTLETTRLGGLRVGALVNLELDVLVKSARAGRDGRSPSPDERTARRATSRTALTPQRLAELGFKRSRPKG